MASSPVAARVGDVVGQRQVLGKRLADDSSLNDDQRFAKRFNLLRIGESYVFECHLPAYSLTIF